MRRIALLGALALLFAAPAAAHAAAWGVSNTTDTPVGQPCAGFTGCSLREAVTSTELNPGPDAILVGTGTYPLTNGELTVTQDLTVARVGAGGATISGSGASRIFNITGSGTTFIFRFLTATDGDVSGAGPSHGGAILGGSGTSIGIESSTISNSSVSADSSDAQGGAIFSQGPVTIGTASGSTTGSSITGNSATATGSPGAAGGGVAVEGASLTVGARTSISNNTASAGSGALDSVIGGGAVANGGITMNGVTVSGNSASGGNAEGGGVAVGGGTATFVRSTFTGNTATTTADSGEGGGGGLVSLTPGSVGLQFSTVSGNTATTTSALGASIGGGGIAAFAGTGTLDASNSTIASNAVSAPAGSFAAGAGVLSVGSTLTLGATILAENTGSAGSQCDGGMDLVSDGYNVLGPVGTCNYSAGTGDVTGVSDAMLRPLGDFGGLTQTRMLRLGSPALDIIPAADSLCSNASVDQRGIARPQNGSCDSGSVEARPATLALSPDPRTFATVPLSQTSTATVGVSNAGDLDTSTAPNASVAAPFSYTSGCASPVAGGGSCLMTLTFAPTAGGSVSRTLQVTSGSLSDTSTLTGIGWAPTGALVIKGSPSVGFKSGLWHGEWPDVLASLTAQWIRCDADGTSNCTDIPGATSTVYRPSGDDAGHTLRVRATGTSSGGVTSDPVTTAASPVVTRIIPAPYKAPQIKRAATPVTGTKLGLYVGQWTGSPIIGYDTQWKRCDHAGANCTDIAGATHTVYVPGTADVDHTLVVRIVATNSAGNSAPVLTAPTGVVTSV